MTLVLPIIKKDLRRTRLFILLSLGILAGRLSMQFFLSGSSEDTDLAFLGADILLLFSWGMFMAVLVTEEALVGRQLYWRSRPISPGSLILGKFALICVASMVPLLASSLMLILIRGYSVSSVWPGLLIQQIQFSVWFIFPVSALAVMAANVFEWTVMLFGASAVVLAIRILAVPLRHYLVLPPEGDAWFVWTAVALLMASSSCLIVYLQYFQRRTMLSRTIFFSALALSACIVHGSRFALLMSGEGVLAPDLNRIALHVGGPVTVSRVSELKGLPEAVLPVVATGLSEGETLWPEQVNLLRKDAPELGEDPLRAYILELPNARGLMYLHALLSETEAGEVASGRAIVSIRLAVLHGQSAELSGPATGFVRGGLRCSPSDGAGRSSIQCWSAFRQPAVLALEQTASPEAAKRNILISRSFSIFPAAFSIVPENELRIAPGMLTFDEAHPLLLTAYFMSGHVAGLLSW